MSKTSHLMLLAATIVATILGGIFVVFYTPTAYSSHQPTPQLVPSPMSSATPTQQPAMKIQFVTLSKQGFPCLRNHWPELKIYETNNGNIFTFDVRDFEKEGFGSRALMGDPINCPE
jgi:hypothetical protein